MRKTISTPDSRALTAMKRKLNQTDSRLETAAKRHHSLPEYNPKALWLQESKPVRMWQMMGDPAVPGSLPLANMVSAVQDLIDPEFDPLTAILGEEPRFLKPLPARIAPEDLEFLRFRGALSIPESGLRNELLRCYIKWVHSFMPVVNLQDLLRCVAENDPGGNISLLLFQAVMFVGTAFVDLKHLQAAGYSTRKTARNAFFTRLRLLYSLDCEEDRIVILQTLLLMTYWSDPENSPQRDIWDWIGICNTQAQSIGLNRDPSTSDMDPGTKRLRTRLWWCLYSRDRLISMGVRRPSQVNEGTSNVPMLKLDDFDFEPFQPSVVTIFRCRQLEDVSHQKRLATMFIEKVKLCQCIGRVLFGQYMSSQRQFGATDRTTITLVPRQASESEFSRCSQRLDTWLGGLPNDAQFIPTSTDNIAEGEDVLLLHGAMLRMLYHATSSALHRPWAAMSKDQSKSRIEGRNIARAKMHEAAAGITRIVQGLNQLNLTRFLPQSGVTVILPAAVAHLSNTMSDNPTVRETSISNFRRCIQVLHGLKDIYPAADMEVANIEAAIKMQSGISNTSFQIMQYNLDITPGKPAMPRKPSSCDPIPPTHTLRVLAEKPPAPNNSIQSPQQRQRKPSTESNQLLPSQPSGPSLHNGFGNQPASTTSSTTTTSVNRNTNNPLNLFSTDIDFFSAPESLEDTINSNYINDNNISSTDADLDGIDWTQELFREDDTEMDFNGSMPFEEHREQSRQFSQQQQQDEEQDLFAFALEDDEDRLTDGPHQRQRSISLANGEITGDLDRDLGFEACDEMF